MNLLFTKQTSKLLITVFGLLLLIWPDDIAGQEKSIIINKYFETENVNRKLLYANDFEIEKNLVGGDVMTFISNNFKPFLKDNYLLLGSYKKTKNGWFYLQIINANNEPKKMVLSETIHVRCDNFEAFRIEADSLVCLGRIKRSTPVSQRPLTNFEYAIPFSILARDTLNMLVHTQRLAGFHQVNFKVSDEQIYKQEHVFDFSMAILQIIVIIVCMLVMLMLGSIFNEKSMIYLGFYFVIVMSSVISFYGFTDTVSFPDGIGLSANNFNSFTVFLLNIAFHPYNLHLMQDIPKNVKFFNRVSYALVGVNVCMALLFFLPISVYQKVDFLQLYTFNFLIFLTIVWVFYSSILAYIKVKIKDFLVAALFGFSPYIFLNIIRGFYGDTNFLAIETSRSGYLFVILSISILAIFRLKDRLVSRKNHIRNISTLKKTMEEIRVIEIENIGRNLHDNVGNMLASALGYLNLKNQKPEITQKLLMEAVNEVRFVSHNLVKHDDVLLQEKIEALVGRFNDFSTINFNYNDFSESKVNQIEMLRQQNIYMIIQEIMTNIIKHSKATEVFIQIFENENNFSISIEDDGIGIKKQHESTGIGLKNIQKRAQISNLKITIDSTHNGTNFIIEIPYEDQSNNH